jgi:hypothetical protein
VTTGSGGCTNLFDATNSSNYARYCERLAGHVRSGEQVVNGPIVFAGEMIFGTNQPIRPTRVARAISALRSDTP